MRPVITGLRSCNIASRSLLKCQDMLLGALDIRCSHSVEFVVWIPQANFGWYWLPRMSAQRLISVLFIS